MKENKKKRNFVPVETKCKIVNEITDLIGGGRVTEEILQKVVKKFPGITTSQARYYWNTNALYGKVERRVTHGNHIGKSYSSSDETTAAKARKISCKKSFSTKEKAQIILYYMMDGKKNQSEWCLEKGVNPTALHNWLNDLETTGKIDDFVVLKPEKYAKKFDIQDVINFSRNKLKREISLIEKTNLTRLTMVIREYLGICIGLKKSVINAITEKNGVSWKKAIMKLKI